MPLISQKLGKIVFVFFGISNIVDYDGDINFQFWEVDFAIKCFFP